MRESLNPSILTRLHASLRPDWTRTVIARRVVAASLVMLAGVAALRSNPDGERAAAVVASRDIGPGVELTTDDVRVDYVMATTLPDGSLSDLATVLGAVPAGPIRRGELLTDIRLFDSRLAEVVAGPNARIVPLHLADPALMDLLRPGDVVDILAAAFTDGDATSQVVATSAVVILVSPKPKTLGPADDRVILVALPPEQANAVAGAALTQAITLTFH